MDGDFKVSATFSSLHSAKEYFFGSLIHKRGMKWEYPGTFSREVIVVGIIIGFAQTNGKREMAEMLESSDDISQLYGKYLFYLSFVIFMF